MPKSISSVLGVNLTNTDASAVFKAGTLVNLDDGGQAVYVKANADINQYAAVIIDASAAATMVTTTNVATNKRIGFAQTAITSAYYGWVQLGGAPKVNLATNCAPNVPLFTTATSGVLDDATVSAGLIEGVIATTSISNATAVTVVAAYPHASWYAAT